MYVDEVQRQAGDEGLDGALRGEMAARKDVALDEVGGFAVRFVALVRNGDDLDDAEAARAHELRANVKVLLQVLVPYRLEHFDRDELVETARWEEVGVCLKLAVVAQDEVDSLAEARRRDALLRDVELLRRDGDPRHLAPRRLRRTDCEGAPTATDLDDVIVFCWR